jgi:hypothetical protein
MADTNIDAFILFNEQENEVETIVEGGAMYRSVKIGKNWKLSGSGMPALFSSFWESLAGDRIIYELPKKPNA